jgi:hypothetical protein
MASCTCSTAARSSLTSSNLATTSATPVPSSTVSQPTSTIPVEQPTTTTPFIQPATTFPKTTVSPSAIPSSTTSKTSQGPYAYNLADFPIVVISPLEIKLTNNSPVVISILMITQKIMLTDNSTSTGFLQGGFPDLTPGKSYNFRVAPFGYEKELLSATIEISIKLEGSDTFNNYSINFNGGAVYPK